MAVTLSRCAIDDAQYYAGQWQSSERRGQGAYTAQYEGQWQPSGHLYNDGSRYKGEWQGELRHGHGVCVSGAGGQYKGEWQGDLRHGHGVCTGSKKGQYKGEWKENKSHGHGVFTGPSNERYSGEWKEGQQHGHGVFVYINGDRFTGEWKEGKRHGYGVYVYINGNQFTGEWQEDLRHGRGVLAYANGNRYAGEWQKDHRHGQGAYIYANGDQQEGLWKNDTREGRFTIRTGEGSLTREFTASRLLVPTDCSDGNTVEYPLPKRPLYAVVIQSLYDEKQTFKVTLDSVVSSLTACGYVVSVIKIGSTQELTQLHLATTTHLLWVRVHGSSSGCQFEQNPEKLVGVNEFKPLVQQLETGSLVLLHSCNTSCIAEHIAREVAGITVVAPTCDILDVGIAHTPTTLRISMLGLGKIRDMLKTYCT